MQRLMSSSSLGASSRPPTTRGPVGALQALAKSQPAASSGANCCSSYNVNQHYDMKLLERLHYDMKLLEMLDYDMKLLEMLHYDMKLLEMLHYDMKLLERFV